MDTNRLMIDRDSYRVSSVSDLPRQVPEWIINTAAARKAIEAFPDMFTPSQKAAFFSGDAKSKMAAIGAIISFAANAKKCKQLNSIEYLCTPIDTLEGWQKVTYYNVGDVVFVTTPGRLEGQKFVSSIFSLTEKLNRINEVRRAAEISGKRKIPMSSLKKMRRTAKGRSYFKDNN
jgi:hypothetical protein